MKTYIGMALSIALLTARPGAVAQEMHRQNVPREARLDRFQGFSLGPNLFIDDYLLAESCGLKRTTHQPEKWPAPVLTHGRPLCYMMVLSDPDVGHYRMWYNLMRPRLGYAYAESEDGIQWHRPGLGLVDISGSKRNNYIDAPMGNFGSVMIDEGPGFAEPAHRYKMAHYHRDSGMWVAFSADGMRFDNFAQNPVLPWKTKDGSYGEGTISDIIDGCWDPLENEYLVGCKVWETGYPGKPAHAGEGMRRVVGMTTSKDFQVWQEPRVIVRPDPNNGLEEFYGFKPTVRGNLYLGFLRVLRDDLPAEPDGPVHGIGWTELLTSRDGCEWIRHQERFLDRDPRPGTWDHAMAWYGDSLTVGDQEYTYYGGYSLGHKVGDRALGLAILRKDGFVSRDAGPEGGLLKTPLARLPGDYLTVNARVRGEMKVRLVGSDGRPLPSFDWADCVPLHGNSVVHPLEWAGNRRVPRGVEVSIEFSMKDAELYGFDVECGERPCQGRVGNAS